VQRFLALLAPDATRFTFQTIDDSKGPKNGDLNRVLHTDDLAKLLPLYERGAAIYVTISETDGRGRRKENIVRFRAVWQEDDAGYAGPFPLEPSIVVKTSPGKYHRYWLVADDWPADEQGRADHAAVMERMVASYGSDNGAKDASRVLRVPGFLHRKAAPHMVSIIAASGQRYTRAEIIAAFPPVPPTNGAGTSSADFDRIYGGREQNYARAALAGCAAELAGTAAGERNDKLNKMAFRMGTMTAHNWIGRDEVTERLMDAAHDCGLVADDGAAAARATLQSGLNAGEANPHADLEEYTDRATAAADTAAPRTPLRWINMSNWDNEPVPEQEWAVLNRIPLRQTALFSGEGAAGKSTIGLHLCAAHALGRDWLGALPEPGPALFIDAEDDECLIHRRLAAVANHHQATFRDLVKGGLHTISFAGQDTVLGAPSRNGTIAPTALYRQVLEAASDIKPKMVCIASSANVYAGSELDRAQVQQFISLLTRLAISANGSLVLISHPSLTGITTDTGLSGNTQWHNAVRARFYLKSVKPEDGEQPDSDLRELVFKKNNYGPVSENIVLRYQGGLFLPVPGMSSLERLAAEQRAEEVLLNQLDRYTKQGRAVSDKPTSRAYAPTVFAQEDEARKGGIRKAHLEDAMRRLFAAGKIGLEPYGAPSKGTTKLMRR
jgi:RecA-family ATPase